MLARACVYGYLYDRHFLASPELLLNELRWLRATNRPEVPRHAIHPDQFDRYRTGLLELLAGRFQALLDYRDSLGDSRAESAAPEASRNARGTVRHSSDPATES